jgi:hypothetical protein
LVYSDLFEKIHTEYVFVRPVNGADRISAREGRKWVDHFYEDFLSRDEVNLPQHHGSRNMESRDEKPEAKMNPTPKLAPKHFGSFLAQQEIARCVAGLLALADQIEARFARGCAGRWTS